MKNFGIFSNNAPNRVTCIRATRFEEYFGFLNFSIFRDCKNTNKNSTELAIFFNFFSNKRYNIVEMKI